MSVANTNDGSQNPPALHLYLSMCCVMKLIDTTTFPKVAADEVYQVIKDSGFVGVQGGDPNAAHQVGLAWATGERANDVGEIEPIIKANQDKGAICSTLHVGWGIEDDATIDAIVDDILNQSAKHDYPLYIETHRATVTQDMWRTVQLARRKPDVRFNGDFSHWYTGLEMPYGGMQMKLEFIEPVFERVRFMHGRIGSSGAMQVDIGDGKDHTPYLYGNQDFLADFREMWVRSMAGFLRSAGPGDLLVFSPELIPSGAYYAIKYPGPDGQMIEQGDRWQQALQYGQIARECFAEAQKRIDQ